MKKWTFFLFFLVVLVAFFSRFYRLSEYPTGLSIDEVAIGYNAYSILKTGRDEWNQYLPTSFKSVGDYKPPLLIYLTVPFIWLLGLNELSIRLPVAIFSMLCVFVFWKLVRHYVFINNKFLILAAVSIFSLSPWLIFYSRSGFEAVPALFFLLVNIYYIFKFRQTQRPVDFFISCLFAFLSAITYHSTKLLAPIINLYAILLDFKFYIKVFKRSYKHSPFFISTLFISLAIVSFWFIDNFVFGPGAVRAQMTFITKDYEYIIGLIPKIKQTSAPTIISFFGLVGFWFKRYLEYFNPNFYLTTGLGLTTPSFPSQGVIYPIEYLFLIVGFLLLLDQQYLSRITSQYTRRFLFGFLLLSVLPGSLTNNSQHSLRNLNMLPVISILTSIGLYWSWENLHRLKWLLVVFVLLGYTICILKFFDYYVVHYPKELSEYRSYGWKEVSIYLRDHRNFYENVYIDPTFGTQGPYTVGVPHLYTLFYSSYDPSKYQIEDVRKTGSSDYENLHFGPIDWGKFDHNQRNLYVGSPWSFPVEVLKSDKVKLYVPFLNKSSGLYVIAD